MIFLETAGKNAISKRAACNMESAAINTNLEAIYVIFVNKTVNLENEATCLLYTKFQVIKFYHLDAEKELSGIRIIGSSR